MDKIIEAAIELKRIRINILIHTLADRTWEMSDNEFSELHAELRKQQQEIHYLRHLVIRRAFASTTRALTYQYI